MWAKRTPSTPPFRTRFEASLSKSLDLELASSSRFVAFAMKFDLLFIVGTNVNCSSRSRRIFSALFVHVLRLGNRQSGGRVHFASRSSVGGISLTMSTMSVSSEKTCTRFQTVVRLTHFYPLVSREFSRLIRIVAPGSLRQFYRFECFCA